MLLEYKKLVVPSELFISISYFGIYFHIFTFVSTHPSKLQKNARNNRRTDEPMPPRLQLKIPRRCHPTFPQEASTVVTNGNILAAAWATPFDCTGKF